MGVFGKLPGSRKTDWKVDRVVISADPAEKAIQGYVSPKSHIHFPISARVFFMAFFALPFAFWIFSQVTDSLRHSASRSASASRYTVISHVPSKTELAETHRDIPDFVSIPNSDI
ncbi:MAG: hypothetical protein DSZ32_01920 [Gammaproteobacteria bacterium]|nr:MAG: hypothetical protein DSZ33_02190 [Gammaproteobacteria bacterium]RTZ61463.1 MAG: hypothetical protein DSZ32_01920 [Gammaproteobacteria bacterium]